MRTIKLAVFLTGLTLTSLACADVPVVDGYDNSNNSQNNGQVIVAGQNDGSTAADNSQAGIKVMPVTEQTVKTVTVPSAATNTSLPTNQRITILERQVNNLTQMLSQYNNLQTQVQNLRGQIEVEKHSLKLLQDQVRSQYQDLDQRLAQNTSKATKPNRKLVAVNANKTPAVSDDATSASDQDLTSNTAAPAATDDATAAAPTTVAATPAVATTTTATANNNDQAAYQAAFDLLKNKNYTQATTSFQKFVKQYPTSQYNVNARYWLGQLYLLQGQPDKAIGQFHVILRNSPTNAKVPDTLLQLGLAYYAKGDLPHARAELDKVQQKYPGTNAAKLAQARMQQIQGQLDTSGAAN